MRTLINFFEDSTNRFGDNIFMWEKKNGKYEGSSYKEIREKVHLFGAGLISIGINKGDRIGLIAEGRNAWLISELGILYAGAANIPMSVRLTREEIQFRIEHSGARMVIVSRQHAPRVKGLIEEIATLERIIYLDEVKEPETDSIYYDTILDKGKELLANEPGIFKERVDSANENDMVNICYTSGTTAQPKGIMLSHLNYVANVHQAFSLVEIPPTYRTLIILPWDHAFAHTNALYAFMGKGASIASVELGSTPLETLKNIPKNIKEIKPNLLMSVPAFAKNFRKNIEKGIREKSPFVEKMFNHALELAYSYNLDGFKKAGGLHKLKLPLLKLYDKILFSKIREGFGGELDFFIGGGALLDIELQRFFYAIGLPMFQGYGLTEAAPTISANSVKRHKLGSSGYVAKGIELKIMDDDGNELGPLEKGEIVIKGENVMLGYWRNEEATRETLKNGWLYTGDMGYMSEDGFLYVLGRFKSLLISDDGEKYSPEGIEEALTDQSKFIEFCTLFNNQKPYTVTLIYLNPDAVKRWAKENKVDLKTSEGQEAVAKLIKSEIDKYKTGNEYADMFPQRWLPAAIGFIPEPYTAENQMLNSTMKMVRGKIEENYKDLLDYLYTPEAKKITNPRNMEIIKTLFGDR
jgi:long-chain acyl-CoA synthetase